MSYQLIEAGIASTILFIYPLLVAVMMIMFFKERINLIDARHYFGHFWRFYVIPRR